MNSAALYVFAAVVLLGVLIFFHELGHFIFAKLMGVKVERFAIGLGPTVYSRKLGETEYILALVPFGGYVKMLGEQTSLEDVGQDETELPTEEDLKRSYERQPVWRRAMIILMGPIFNIVLAFLVFILIYAAYGEPVRLPQIGAIMVNSPAAEAGLKGGDIIVSIDGRSIDKWRDVPPIIKGNHQRKLRYIIKRGDETFEVFIKPELRKAKTLLYEDYEDYLIGIEPSQSLRYDSIGLGDAVSNAFVATVNTGFLIIEVLIKMVQRIIPAETIGGPLLIFQMAGEQASKGLVDYLFLLAGISVNLGVLNLLPIPVLDGGHLVFLSIEAVRRKPLSEKVVAMAQRVGMTLLLLLMVFATYNDIVRLVTGRTLP